MSITPFDGRDWEKAAAKLHDADAQTGGREKLSAVAEFLIDLEKLKLVDRRAYVSDHSRRENSAEHSWHLALALLAVARELNPPIDIHKALLMALVHDVCEIDAGDTPVYGAARPDQHEAELRCIDRLAAHGIRLGPELRELWLEFEAQQSAESRWVKVLDRLMPFVVNLATQGRTWKEQSVCRSQVLKISEPVRLYAPQIFEWMRQRIEICVRDGWLRDA
jgi:putative hydrolase of HD superfamily